MNSKPIKLGLVGQPSSGKDTFAYFLVRRHSFIHISTSKYILKHIISNDLGTPTRELYQKTANILREKHGPDYFARLALQEKNERVIISGLRTVAEVEKIKKEGGKIVKLTASQETRYKWAKGRNGSKDKITFEQFVIDEERDSKNLDHMAQNVLDAMELADFHLENDGTRDDLLIKIDNLLKFL